MLSLTILGNNSALPAYGRHPTAQVLYCNGENYLIDCGEGTQQQMALYKIKRSRINRIFISHLHGDHYFGLIGLLTSLGLLGRIADLHIYAPHLLKAIINLQLEASGGPLPYPVHFHDITEEGEIANDKHLKVEAFKTSHRIACWGFKFTEIKAKRTLLPKRLQSYEVPVTAYQDVAAGNDFVMKNGTIIPNGELTEEAPLPRSYAFCADTRYDRHVAEKVAGCNLIYHETTYLAELAETAHARFHSTSADAAEIAKLAGVEKLLIGHFSSKYQELDPFLQEASAIFANTQLAVEGATFMI